jgi:nucleoside phosphorylase
LDKETRILKQSSLNVPSARISTGNTFVNDAVIKETPPLLTKIQKMADLVDMEAYAIVEMCKKRSMHAYLIKAVSDNVLHPAGGEDFLQNLNSSMRASIPVLLDVLKIINATCGREAQTW